MNSHIRILFRAIAQKRPTAHRMLGYGFELGTDFESVPKSTPVNNGGIQMLKDYAITLDMANILQQEHHKLLRKINENKEISNGSTFGLVECSYLNKREC